MIEDWLLKNKREVRDDEPYLDCEAFDTSDRQFGEIAHCDTDGHYRCVECKWMSDRAREAYRTGAEIVFDEAA